ncbi:unnamed protein product [Paramecium octaurelia]|uniref:Uncharacterized protein n=1 Tax=Paramecium octaurelia TaxID=43137 RepID=A0A8S1SUY6_PAROT|nr:unnamed protein product [Paramecium octaurelia]
MRQFRGGWNKRGGQTNGRSFRGGNQSFRGNRNNNNNRSNNQQGNFKNTQFRRPSNQNQNSGYNRSRNQNRGGRPQRGRGNQQGQGFQQQNTQRRRRFGFKQNNQNGEKKQRFIKTGRKNRINSDVYKLAKDIQRKSKMEQALDNYWKKGDQTKNDKPTQDSNNEK